MKKTVFIFASLIVAILALFQLSKFSVMRGDSSLEISIAAIAIVFFFIGIYINKKRKHSEIHSAEAKTQEINHAQIETLGLSKREYEVLCQLAKGHSTKKLLHCYLSQKAP